MITHCLTLWPEWAYAVAALGKRVENRSWAAPSSMIGQWIGIHAGAYMGGRKNSGAAECVLEMAETARQHGHAVDCLKVLANGNVLIADNGKRDIIARSAVVAVALVGECVPPGERPSTHRRAEGWSGDADLPWGNAEAYRWIFDDVVRLPVTVGPVRGAQGLWKCPPALASKVLSGVSERRFDLSGRFGAEPDERGGAS